MIWFTDAFLLVGMVEVSRAQVFDRSFLLRMQDITQTNKDLSDTNIKLNKTIHEKMQIIEGLNLTLVMLEKKQDGRFCSSTKMYCTIFVHGTIYMHAVSMN